MRGIDIGIDRVVTAFLATGLLGCATALPAQAPGGAGSPALDSRPGAHPPASRSPTPHAPGDDTSPPYDTARPPFTLRQVVASALETHPGLRSARAAAAAAGWEVAGARAGRLPSVSFSGQSTRFQEPMVVAPLHGFDPRNPPTFDETLIQGVLAAEYEVYDGGARGARIRAARSMEDAAGAVVAAEAEAVIAEVVDAYLAARSAVEQRAAYRQQTDALEAERARSALFLAEGRAPRVAVLRTDAALSQARAALESAEARVALTHRRVARLAGLPPEDVTAAGLASVDIPSTSPIPDRDALLAAAAASNPRLRSARQRAEAADRMADAARGAFLPSISLAGRYNLFASATIDPVFEWQAGLQLRYPIFTGGARRSAVGRAAADATAAEAEVERAARAVADAVDGALVAWESATARLTALRAAVTQAEEVARIEALALAEGAGTQTDYLRAEASLLEARAARTEAKHAVLQARVALARATGTLDSDTLWALMTEVDR